MTDLKSGENTLAGLQARMDDLVRWRTETLAIYRARIADIERYIEEVNREFDEKAIPLQRQVDELRPDPVQRIMRRWIDYSPDPEWSEEDQRHYLELLGK